MVVLSSSLTPRVSLVSYRVRCHFSLKFLITVEVHLQAVAHVSHLLPLELLVLHSCSALALLLQTLLQVHLSCLLHVQGLILFLPCLPLLFHRSVVVGILLIRE